MTKFMLTGRSLHPKAESVASSFRQGRVNRREYLALMAGLGVSAAGAFALGGIVRPSAKAPAALTPSPAISARYSRRLTRPCRKLEATDSAFG